MIRKAMYNQDKFEQEYTYKGDDLGAVWTKDKTVFRVWAPGADEVVVNLYTSGTAKTENPIGMVLMTEDKNGTWTAQVSGNLHKTYYTYTVTRRGKQEKDICDPYARTTGVNGRRAMVIDLDSTNPDGWENDKNPHEGKGITDAVIYEGHIRDLTVDSESGISKEYQGKFLGLTETGTTTSGGVATVVDHMKELGITHLHLLPVYDFGSVDEAEEGSYNWGYDPVNYNVPEGSYSTDPYHGEVRVKEFKQMVQALHKNGIGVIMDVVYNHVYHAEEFCVNRIVPGYFSRSSADGDTLSNDSECDNDTASERSMVRKYIVDSVCYWADEYHIDGFRFDLVGLLDIDTVNELVKKVQIKHPSVIFYGEGWNMATEVARNYIMATQKNSRMTPGFAYFNDSIRDGLKGSIFKYTIPGYVSGRTGEEKTIEKNFLGKADWCSSPSQAVNYVSCHDNHTLFDRLVLSASNASKEELIRMNKLAAAVYILAEGVPFMQAGEEFLRSKKRQDGSFSDNSYNEGDEVNAIRWGMLEDTSNADVSKYYKGLIAFRKAHGAFRLSAAAEVDNTVFVISELPPKVIGFVIQGGINKETAAELLVVFNANQDAVEVALPDGEWAVYINDEKAGTDVLETVTRKTAAVAPISAMVFLRTSTSNDETEN